MRICEVVHSQRAGRVTFGIQVTFEQSRNGRFETPPAPAGADEQIYRSRKVENWVRRPLSRRLISSLKRHDGLIEFHHLLSLAAETPDRDRSLVDFTLADGEEGRYFRDAVLANFVRDFFVSHVGIGCHAGDPSELSTTSAA